MTDNNQNLAMANVLPLVEDSYNRLLGYLANRPLECFDRADFKGLPLIIKLQRSRDSGNLLSKVILKMIYLKAMLAPFLTRIMLGVKPALTSGGLGFYARACVDCHQLEDSDRQLQRANELLTLLKGLNSVDPPGAGWGFPFDWWSYDVIPANTPIGYTTCCCADAFFAYYCETGDEEALDMAGNALTWLSNNLNHTEIGGGIALSYTPLDTSTVPNSNVLTAALMLELDAKRGTNEFTELAESMMRFVLFRQQPDGSWFYDHDGTRIDHYHTAMTVYGLARGMKYVSDEGLRSSMASAVDTGLRYHLDKMWIGDSPRNSTWKVYPLDPMSPAESFIMFHLLWQDGLPKDSAVLKLLERRWVETAEWTIRHMQARDGSFATLYIPGRSLRLRSLRWGDAQMLRGLALTVHRFRAASGV